MTIEADAEIRRKEAADWFARLNQRRVTTADVRRFSAWRCDPENARAFARLEALWSATATLGRSPDIQILAEAAARPRRSRPSRNPPKGRLVQIGAVGALALVLCAAGSAWLALRPATYATEIGEQRTVALADGSHLILDTGSRVSVRFTGERRTVALTQGQAMFEVARDAGRPFVVRAGDTEVTALGTRFDVRRSGAGARVILVEGRVAVRKPAASDTRWSLSPGQQLLTSAPRPRVAPVNVVASTSWSAGRLTFDDTPIAVAVAEVNRYSRSPIVLQDARLASVPVSGVFNVGDIDGFVAALSDLYGLDATISDDGRILLGSASKK
jgi:transmembrane sensor